MIQPQNTGTGTNTAGGPLLEVRSLHVRFGAQPVLKDINLQIPRGQTLAIIGESGCGKTVLLKTMIALIRPTEGDILFDGQSLLRLRDWDLTRQRRRFGYVFQSAALFDSLTVGQNVAFPLRQDGGRRDADVQEIVLSRLAEVGLPDTVVAKKPAELSGGMRKRVGLARALVLDPELVLYDEPTTGLDPIMSDVINELMLRMSHRTDVTSVIVTHDMRTAQKVADRVVMIMPLSRLEEGEPQLIFDGTPQQLQASKDPRVRQFVLGEAGERLVESQTQARRAAVR
jgi:phospholipid/cholesterol/gamma-HCH transport system ATP-binding protein